jgi:Na+/phosphate symporter
MEERCKVTRHQHEYVNRLQAQLDQWRTMMRDVEARAADASDERHEHFVDLTNQLERVMAEAEQKVRELNSAAEASWESKREGVESAWRRLNDLFAKTLSGISN